MGGGRRDGDSGDSHGSRKAWWLIVKLPGHLKERSIVIDKQRSAILIDYICKMIIRLARSNLIL